MELEAKVTSLKARLANLRDGMRKLSDVGTQIAELERNHELEIANYKYFKGTLEKARIDEALDPSKMPNISAVQRPSPPARVYGKRDKIVKMFAAGGFGIAIGLVLLKELLLNHTVKRADELETRLGTRLLVSVPYSGRNGRLRLPWKRPGASAALVPSKGKPEIPPWEPTHFIRPYAAAIRDRLGLYFELNQVTHKPKLVGVTGFRSGSGISTFAAGVAAALSEVGEGKVLLVDVNLGPGEVHPFFNGRPALPLTAALSANGSLPSAADNLYLATVGPSSPGVAQLGLKKFFDLMPNLQASDFDYVIFDMPPLGQTSPSLGIAGFMDKVLLVVEAEKTSREVIKRGYEALRASRDNVSVVMNKTRTYVPKWLEGDN
jgi:Mrp family chromosome partitioning ATPase